MVIFDTLCDMTKRLIDVDDTLLAEVRDILGSATMSEAVNAALAEVINAEGRPKEAFDRTETHALDEPEILRGEWRWGKPPC